MSNSSIKSTKTVDNLLFIGIIYDNTMYIIKNLGDILCILWLDFVKNSKLLATSWNIIMFVVK